jgi:hypothetical protein
MTNYSCDAIGSDMFMYAPELFKIFNFKASLRVTQFIYVYKYIHIYLCHQSLLLSDLGVLSDEQVVVIY